MPNHQAPADLRAFLSILRREGELVEVDAPVDWNLEAAEVHRRVIAAGGPALLFKNVKGSSFPLVTNLFGTAKPVNVAFGSKPEEVVSRVAKLPEELMPPTLGKLWGQRDLFGSHTYERVDRPGVAVHTDWPRANAD